MKLKYLKMGGNFNVNTPIYVYLDKVLPQGFGVIEKAYAGVKIQPDFDMVEPEIILISDPDFSNGRKAYPYEYKPAIKYAGGEDKIKEMIKRLLDKWRKTTE